MIVDKTTAKPYSAEMQIVRTRMYQQATKKLFSIEELRRVDVDIQADPLIGDIIPGTNGVRKVRVAFGGRGKRGGARVIYYFWREGEIAYLIFAYAKNRQSDLKPAEKKMVSQLALMLQRGEYEN